MKIVSQRGNNPVPRFFSLRSESWLSRLGGTNPLFFNEIYVRFEDLAPLREGRALRNNPVDCFSEEPAPLRRGASIAGRSR